MAIVKPVLNDPTVGGSRGVWGNTLNENHAAQDSFNGDVADKLNTFYSSLTDMGLTDGDLTNGDLEASMITIFTAMQEGSRLLMDVTTSDPNFLSILPHEGAITILKGSPSVATIILETEGNGRYETSYDETLIPKIEIFINVRQYGNQILQGSTDDPLLLGSDSETYPAGTYARDINGIIKRAIAEFDNGDYSSGEFDANFETKSLINIPDFKNQISDDVVIALKTLTDTNDYIFHTFSDSGLYCINFLYRTLGGTTNLGYVTKNGNDYQVITFYATASYERFSMFTIINVESGDTIGIRHASFGDGGQLQLQDQTLSIQKIIF